MSSDCGEDNDDKEQAAAEKKEEDDEYEEDFEYYDEEAEEEEEEKGLDPSKMISDEKVSKEEREMMGQMSEIEKKIVMEAEV